MCRGLLKAGHKRSRKPFLRGVVRIALIQGITRQIRVCVAGCFLLPVVPTSVMPSVHGCRPDHIPAAGPPGHDFALSIAAMAIWPQRLRGLTTSLVILTCAVATSRDASAQNDNRQSLLSETVKGTLLDPTTYVPAIVSYDATMRDWKTSQPFFQNGFMEHNARFTVSGLADTTPVGYGTGKTQILNDALVTLGTSVLQNAGNRLVAHALLERYPTHRKMVKTMAWIERISVASLMSYQRSAQHYRQGQHNEELAAQLGFR
jgi:hypothetical protein